MKPFGPRDFGGFDDAGSDPSLSTDWASWDAGPANFGAAPVALVTSSALVSLADGTGTGTDGPGTPPSPFGTVVDASTGSGATTSPFVIVVNWDTSVQSAPSSFMPAVLAAVRYLERVFTNAVTITINVGYGEVAGTPMTGGNLGQSQSFLTNVNYTALAAALKATAKSATDIAAVASLPVSNPTGGTLWATTAESKALGLAPASASADASVGFSATAKFTYDPTNGVASGTYDFTGVVLHEISETMGRILLAGAAVGGTSNSFTALDLYHYASAGVRDFAPTQPGYFSIDSGTTNLAAFNTVPTGDPGDWDSSVLNNALDAFGGTGSVTPFSPVDIIAMQAVGWNSGPALPVAAAPTGLALAAAAASLTGLQTATGLAAGQPIAFVNQIGGAATDLYTYGLGGFNGAAFALTGLGGQTALTASGSGLTGGAGGRLYALSVTATDRTTGAVAPTRTIDVIVASGGNDTVSISALSGRLAQATPTFIYGLDGNDTLNGTKMTGPLWFVGGAGGDIMTGGSGANNYLYGSTGDSTVSAMDVIANFNAASDLIDLSGLGVKLNVAGAQPGRLAAHTIGWQVSGGNTFVYVNTSAGSETLSGANMKIELQGIVPLSSGNFAHA